MLRRNVLIFHSGALGDFVLSWPLALALGRIYAQSRIIYVAASEKGALAELALRIDSSDIEGGWHHLFSADAAPPANVLRMLEGSHAIFSFVAQENSIWAGNVRRLAPDAKLFFIDPNPPPEFAAHVSQLLLNQLHADRVVFTAVLQILKSIQDRGIGGSRSEGGPMILHPGAGAEKKRWPLERFVSLAKMLHDAGRAVAVVLGEVERELWGEAESDAFGGAVTMIKPRTLVDLFTVLMRSSALVGNDSGPAHLAGIIGVPTIALFGPTDPAIWRPIGPKVRVIHGESMEAITANEVLDAVSGGIINGK